jgi:hypothetical protein
MHVCARACVRACVRACAFAGSKLRGISESGLSRSNSSLSASSGSLLGDDLSDEMEEEIREVSFLSTLPCRHRMGVESALLNTQHGCLPEGADCSRSMCSRMATSGGLAWGAKRVDQRRLAVCAERVPACGRLFVGRVA